MVMITFLIIKKTGQLNNLKADSSPDQTAAINTRQRRSYHNLRCIIMDTGWAYKNLPQEDINRGKEKVTGELALHTEKEEEVVSLLFIFSIT